MSSRELNVDCPCCRANLVVDPETGGIIKAVPHKPEAPSLQDFLKADKNRAQDLEDKFAESKRMEDSRLKLLEKKFEWAKKNKDKLPEAPRPGIQWD
jgi:hypothetical protein